MLRLLGPTRVAGNDWPRLTRPAFLAVALIDLAPGRILTRETLAARLRDGATPEKANNNLRQVLSRIRAWEAATGETILVDTPAGIARNEATLASDLWLLLSSGEPDTPAKLRLFAELYGGDLLADIVEESEVTGQWIVEQRAWLRDRFVKLALAGAQHIGGPVAEDVLRRLSEEAPYDDAVTRATMIAVRAHPPRVRAVYDRFAQRLAELHSAPEPATRDLLRELTPGSLRPAATRPVAAPGLKASIESVPRVLILPPEAGALPLDSQQLGNALIDEVTHTLGRLRTFAVFAPHTARQLVASPFPSGNPYGVDYLVTTRLVPATSENRLRIALTRLETHELLMSEELSFARDDLSGHHHRLAAALGMRLAQGIERTELSLYGTTESPSAYVSYLFGCEALQRIDLPSLRRAKRHFRNALKASRYFVAARAMLARTICHEWVVLDRKERGPIDEAVALAREAADIDPLDPGGHREIGHALLYLGEIDEGVESLRAATHLAPHLAEGLFHYGDGLVHLGDMPEARRVMDKALSLNPLAPDVYYWVSATADYFLGDYESASATFKQMQDREPAARVIAAVEAMNGNMEEAARHRDIFMAGHPDFRIADYMFPQRRPEDRAHILEGLRRAGFS